ncbi:Ppx/GppA phosphatase family protein [Elongatibacter sediminis]|uniref:Ppx/GppA phosphatase family protein n=1 Tax=Elongatibacter sediminis TaxID=3119006 RepID=A0AAW9RHE8_9GAMM
MSQGTSPAKTSPETAATYAAVDLGSNSFHMLVARREHGELRIIDRIKEMVRLGGGLDREGVLDADTQQRALSCLARFGQRLRGLPADNIRAVGTQTFRRLRNANAFLLVAETGLGASIDIIGGREEARLIYLGVSQGVSGHEDRRLVIDIGGGSTEFVIGQGVDPIEMESVQFGCVSLTRRFFGDGRISARRWTRAVEAVLTELQELQTRYRTTGWQTAIGSSGTVLAVAEICRQLGWTERDIDAASVGRLRERLLQAGRCEDVNLPGLSERRQPVLAGGVVMLQACFEAFGLQQLRASPFALREGLLHDMLGRLENRDPREATIAAFRARYGVDAAQADRVRSTALEAFDQLADRFELTPVHRRFLAWGAELHEVGLCVSHSHYERHSGYLVGQSDMAGFTTQEQCFVAALVQYHRRPVPRDYGRALPSRLHGPLRMTLFCLRFSWVLCRTRDTSAIPEFRLNFNEDDIEAEFAASWRNAHPLTIADLESETRQLRAIGLNFSPDVPGITA